MLERGIQIDFEIGPDWIIEFASIQIESESNRVGSRRKSEGWVIIPS